MIFDIFNSMFDITIKKLQYHKKTVFQLIILSHSLFLISILRVPKGIAEEQLVVPISYLQILK